MLSKPIPHVNSNIVDESCCYISFQRCFFFVLKGVHLVEVDPINPLPDTEEIKAKQAFEDDWGPAPEYKEPEVPTWNEFTQTTTFHGIKYIFAQQKESKFRR